MSTIEYLARFAAQGAVVQIGPGEVTVPFKVTVTDENWEQSREGHDLPSLFAQMVSLWEEYRASRSSIILSTGSLVPWRRSLKVDSRSVSRSERFSDRLSALTRDVRAGYFPPQDTPRPEESMIVMTAADRTAAELYVKDLETHFNENQIMVRTARDLGDTAGLDALHETSRTLYREISEVQVALKLGVMPAREA